MDKMVFGKQLKALRVQRGMMQKDVAKKLNVAPSTISNWENGWRQPSLSELKRISEIFEVSLAHFEMYNAFKDSDELLNSGNYQLIEHKSLVTKYAHLEHILFVLTMIFLIVHLPFTSTFGFILMGLGGVAALLFVVAYTINSLFLSTTTYQQSLIPITQKVFYIHDASEKNLLNNVKRLTISTIGALILTILFHTFVMVIWIQHQAYTIILIHSVLGIASIIALTVMYFFVTRGGVFEKEVEYAVLIKSLKRHAPVVALVITIISFVLYGLINQTTTYLNTIGLWVIPLGLLQALACILNYFLMIKTQHHLQSMRLIAEDESSVQRPLFTKK